MTKQVECVVHGIVQGVLYRDFVKRSARKLGVLGTVKNQSDGSVLIYAEGEEEILKTFLENIRKGSFFSRVEKVTVSWKDSSGNYSDFSIVY